MNIAHPNQLGSAIWLANTSLHCHGSVLESIVCITKSLMSKNGCPISNCLTNTILGQPFVLAKVECYFYHGQYMSDLCLILCTVLHASSVIKSNHILKNMFGRFLHFFSLLRRRPSARLSNTWSTTPLRTILLPCAPTHWP